MSHDNCKHSEGCLLGEKAFAEFCDAIIARGKLVIEATEWFRLNVNCYDDKSLDILRTKLKAIAGLSKEDIEWQIELTKPDPESSWEIDQRDQQPMDH